MTAKKMAVINKVIRLKLLLGEYINSSVIAIFSLIVLNFSFFHSPCFLFFFLSFGTIHFHRQDVTALPSGLAGEKFHIMQSPLCQYFVSTL